MEDAALRRKLHDRAEERCMACLLKLLCVPVTSCPIILAAATRRKEEADNPHAVVNAEMLGLLHSQEWNFRRSIVSVTIVQEQERIGKLLE